MTNGYEQIVLQATGCSAQQASAIGEIMRDVIFHSTMDWQSPEELMAAPRIAYLVLQVMNDDNGAF